MLVLIEVFELLDEPAETVSCLAATLVNAVVQKLRITGYRA